MAEVTVTNGWQRLANGFDVEFRHGIPVRLADNGKQLTIPVATLLDEITVLGGLRVELGEWLPGENPDEHEARLSISGDQLEEVLKRLALSSAAVFFDRFHKPVDKDDVDWDILEYVTDYRAALGHCRLEGSDADREAFRDAYLETMHQETRRLAQSPDMPLTEPE
ncbi:MAG: hypothetical protein WBN51_10015 [Gammaproteobacteria bacterium]